MILAQALVLGELAAAVDPAATGVPERVVVDGTFGLYLGWVAVATCANVTAALVACRRCGRTATLWPSGSCWSRPRWAWSSRAP